MSEQFNGAIVWFRRDMRVSDNPALARAAAAARQVTPAYFHCQQEESPWVPGAASNWWLHHSLDDLQSRLRSINMELVVRSGGGSLEMLKQLISQTGAQAVYWNRLYEPAILERDARVERSLTDMGIKVATFNASLLLEPQEVATQAGKPYRVFTPYYRRSRGRIRAEDGLHAAPGAASEPPIPLDSMAVAQLGLRPRHDWADGFRDHWTPGESGAVRALEQFAGSDVLFDYARGRDLPGRDGVSRLSPHLHFGELSPARVWHEAMQQAVFDRREDDVEPYLRQLIWRDFAHHLLFYFPHTATEEFNPLFARFPWRQDPDLFNAWSRGATGVPFIDAGMRQLWRSGWMHNRVRMNVASYLCKHCLIDWRCGSRWFWDTLVDADLANNTMGWQWAAGCGADAAPFFRIFNPVRQGEKFDPDGGYVRQWVPELAALDAARVHQPWVGSERKGQLFDLDGSPGYPEPVVDLATGREEALAAYRTIRKPSGS